MNWVNSFSVYLDVNFQSAVAWLVEVAHLRGASKGQTTSWMNGEKDHLEPQTPQTEGRSSFKKYFSSLK